MASILKVDKLDPQSGTALEIGTSGDTISVPSGATLDISASTLTPPATMPASSGINFTALNATNLGSGTVPTARLGSGTASSSTVLYGDQTYKAEPGGGKILQAVTSTDSTSRYTTSTTFVTGNGGSNTMTVDITPSATSSKVFVIVSGNVYNGATNAYSIVTIYRDSTDLGAASDKGLANIWSGGGDIGSPLCVSILDSPSSTSAITYQVYFRVAGGTAYLNENANKGVITAFEVGA